MAVGFGRFNSSKLGVGAGAARMNANRADRQTYPEVAIARCSINIRKTIAIVVLAGCDAMDLISKGA
jgi:hypothetical protein